MSKKLQRFCLLITTGLLFSVAANATAEPSDERLNEIAKFLVSKDVAKNRSGMHAAVRVGKYVVPRIFDELERLQDKVEEDSAWEIKVRLGRVLVEIFENAGNRSPDFLPRLEQFAHHPKRFTSSASISALAKFKGSKEARRILKEVIQDPVVEEHSRARAIGALAAASGRDKAEIPFFRKMLHDKAGIVQMRAAKTLARMGDDSGRSLCIERLKNPPKVPTDELSIEAAAVLGALGDPELLPFLRKIAKDDRYGFAQGEALLATWDIEFENLSTVSARLIYLKRAFANKRSTRWAIKKIGRMVDPGARAILEEAAEDPEHPGSNAAKRSMFK